MTLKDYLQLFRAQTAAATIILLLVPYLTNATFFSLETLIIGIFALFVHWVTFGHNSLMDTAMGYDRADPNKSHHPLVNGRIGMATAHNLIHWSLCGLGIWAILITLTWSPNPTFALAAFMIWWIFGYAYNNGLSKESLYGFLASAICFTSMTGWGWFLSHETLDSQGWLLLTYIFMTALFQISWSGHLKELEIKERSNILVKMGARIEKGNFLPGYSLVYGLITKLINVPVLGALLLFEGITLSRMVWFGVMVVLTSITCGYLICPRPYIRSKELRNMSIMEILTIYTPIPLVLPWLEAIILMLFGVAYFWTMNKLLWGVASHPRV